MSPLPPSLLSGEGVSVNAHGVFLFIHFPQPLTAVLEEKREELPSVLLDEAQATSVAHILLS